MSAGPSPHLSWRELACVNRRGTPWEGFPPGEVIASYPSLWRLDRARDLGAAFEAIRADVGGPLFVTSAYRTPSYNKAIGGAPASQHLAGRALDLRHPTLSPTELFLRVRHLVQSGRLRAVGGLGLYATFVHFDIRAVHTLVVWSHSADEVPGALG